MVVVVVQFDGGVPKYIPPSPMPEKFQRPTCPTRRQKRLPSSQSAPTSLNRAAFSPGRSCIDSAVSSTIRTFGFKVSAMVFTVCSGYASPCNAPGSDHVVANSASAKQKRRNAADGADLMVGCP
jgi:hypothetical protein